MKRRLQALQPCHFTLQALPGVSRSSAFVPRGAGIQLCLVPRHLGIVLRPARVVTLGDGGVTIPLALVEIPLFDPLAFHDDRLGIGLAGDFNQVRLGRGIAGLFHLDLAAFAIKHDPLA